MSAILQGDHKITTSVNFYKVPSVESWGLPDLIPAPPSGGGSSVSSVASSTHHTIDREEPCLITKSSCYTHKKVHWIGVDPETKDRVEQLLIGRRIVYPTFSLDSAVNISNLDRVLCHALDKYAFFAVTGSLNTLKELISLVETDNKRRQGFFNGTGIDPPRWLGFRNPVFANPQYELVALRPHHMLPNRKVLVVYSKNPTGLPFKTYVPGEDNTLRESPGHPSSPRLPPFSSGYHRPGQNRLNPFLVILNAEIKFRRYLRQQNPPPLPLPAEVMTLIHLTTELVDLIYWDPIILPNTVAAEVFFGVESPISEPTPHSYLRYTGHYEDDVQNLDARPGTIREPPADATLEERMAYGRAIMSGHDYYSDEDSDQASEEYEGEHDLSRSNEAVQEWRSNV